MNKCPDCGKFCQTGFKQVYAPNGRTLINLYAESCSCGYVYVEDYKKKCRELNL